MSSIKNAVHPAVRNFVKIMDLRSEHNALNRNACVNVITFCCREQIVLLVDAYTRLILEGLRKIDICAYDRNTYSTMSLIAFCLDYATVKWLPHTCIVLLKRL